MKSELILTCKEHVDIAMDEIINGSERFPIMEVAKDGSCAYCDKLAEYVIK